MQAKEVNASSVEIIQQMTHQDVNLAGNVHGGVIMKHIDNTAGIVATRHAQRNCVTASVDRIDFHSPVFIGDLLRVKSCVNYVGKKSMEIGVRVVAENFLTGECRHTASAYLTFVAVDDSGKPVEIPAAIYETEEQLKRSKEAAERKRLRLAAIKEAVV